VLTSDGKNVTSIVPSGATWTPKQLQLDAKNRKLYWSDREGMRVMRANLDGSKSKRSLKRGMARPAGLTRGIGVLVSRLM